MMKKYFPINPHIRALSIASSATGALVLVVDFTGQAGSISILLIQVLLYMVAANYRVRKGKYPCFLLEITSGNIIYIDIKGKKTPLVLFGVDVPEKHQKGHEITKKWLTDFLQSKSLSFTNSDDICYYKGIQRPRFSENTSTLYANGQDVALAGLQSGHLFISSRYKTPKIYQFAHTEAEANNLGIHALNEARPDQGRNKAPIKKNIHDKKRINKRGGDASWI